MKRLLVEQALTCNVDRLYGPMADTIKYLQEIHEAFPEAQLEENWTGYEDMEIRFAFMRAENDDEFAARKTAERERRSEAAKLAAWRKKDEAALAKVKAATQERNKLLRSKP